MIKKSIKISVTFLVAFLTSVSLGAVMGSQTGGNAQTTTQSVYAGNQIGVGLEEVQQYARVIQNMEPNGVDVSTSFRMHGVNESLTVYLNSVPFMNYYQTTVSGAVNVNWGVSYNYSNHNVSLNIQFDIERGSNMTEITWSADSQGWMMNTPNVTMAPVIYHSAAGFENWGGYELYNPYNPGGSGYEEIDGVVATLPISTITTPPANQQTTNYMGESPWIALEPIEGGFGGIYQTGYQRNYYNDFIPGFPDYWHSYNMRYETYPAPSYSYANAPDLTPGQQVEFSVQLFAPRTQLYYAAEIVGSSTIYTATTNYQNGYTPPQFAAFILEDAWWTPPLRQSFYGQLPEFSTQYFESISLSNTYYSVPSAYTLYSDGYYVYPPYQVSTDYNDLNTGFGNGGSGSSWYVGLTWGNSYFNWTYCNG